MSKVVETRIRALQRQVETLKSFLMEPRGVFETIDTMIKNTRYANKETLRQLQTGGLLVKTPAAKGQILQQFTKGPVLRRIREIIGRFRR